MCSDNYPYTQDGIGHDTMIPHYNDVIMDAMASLITSLTIVYTSVYSGADQSSASLAFVWGIHRSPVNSCTNGQWRGKCYHLMTSSCRAFNEMKIPTFSQWFYGIITFILFTRQQWSRLWFATNRYLHHSGHKLSTHICLTHLQKIEMTQQKYPREGWYQITHWCRDQSSETNFIGINLTYLKYFLIQTQEVKIIIVTNNWNVPQMVIHCFLMGFTIVYFVVRPEMERAST